MGRIISGWKVFTTIKEVLKIKLDKTLHANVFNNTILHAMLRVSKTWATMKKEHCLFQLGGLWEYLCWEYHWQWEFWSRSEWRMWLQSTRSRSSAKLDTSFDSQTSGGPVQLLSGMQETGNNYLENLQNNGKMKLSIYIYIYIYIYICSIFFFIFYMYLRVLHIG